VAAAARSAGGGSPEPPRWCGDADLPSLGALITQDGWRVSISVSAQAALHDLSRALPATRAGNSGSACAAHGARATRSSRRRSRKC